MSKTVSTKRTSSVFLAAILAAGTIAAFSPSFMVGTAQAESYYGMDNNHDKSYGKDVNAKSIKCNNINVNVNGLELDILLPFLIGIVSYGEGNEGVSSYGSGERSHGVGGQSGSDRP